MLESSNIRSAADRTLHLKNISLEEGCIGKVEDGYYQIRVYNGDFTIEFEIMNKQIVSVRSKSDMEGPFRLGISSDGVICLKEITDPVNIDIEYSSSLIEISKGTPLDEESMPLYAFNRFYTDLYMSVNSISVDENLEVKNITANIIDTKKIVLGDWVFSKSDTDNNVLEISINKNQS